MFLCSDYPNAAYIGYYKLLKPAIVVRDPELIKDVLIKDHFSFHANDNAVSERYDPLMLANPFFVVDDEWKRHRGAIASIFTANKVKTIYPLMESSCKKLVNYLKAQPKGKDFDAKSVSCSAAQQRGKLIQNVIPVMCEIYHGKCHKMRFQHGR